MSRANVLNDPGSSELAAKLLAARIQQELRTTGPRKAAHSDVASDVGLLRQLLSPQPQTGLAGIFPSPNESLQEGREGRTQAAAGTQP
jgi:hypothetical protein